MGVAIRRAFTRGLLALLALVVTLHLAGGWYFSSMIGQDALAVRPYPPEADLQVVRVRDGAITVRDPSPANSAIRSAGTFGLEWDGGYGVVSGPPRVNGERVTRQWRPVEGRATSRQLVTIDATARPHDELVRNERLVRYSGRLTARYTPGRSDTWGILVHGKGNGPQEMERVAAPLRELGLPTLSIHYRNDPGQPRDPSGRYQFGATEWHDLAAAVDYARSHGARRLVLCGTSMGGGIVASYLRHSKNAPVDAVVLDSPMLSMQQTVEFNAAQRTVLGTSLPIPGSLVWTAQGLTTMRYGFDWDATDYLDHAEWVRMPVFIAHGARDATVPISTSRQLARAHRQVTLYEEPEADHVQSWNYDPAGYSQRIRRFVRAALE